MSRVFVGYGQYGVGGVDEEFIRFVFDVVLGSTIKKMESEVGVIITDDEQIAKLNRRYRGKNKTTNVLSFANLEIEGSPKINSDVNYLGDVYISYPVLVREAKNLKISDKERFAQLLVHGLLHLVGFDHEEPAAMADMEALEDRIIQMVI